jgi:hypothetical protein
MDFGDYAQFLFFILWALYLLVSRGIRAARQRKARQQAAEPEEASPELEELRAEEAEEQREEEEEDWFEELVLESTPPQPEPSVEPQGREMVVEPQGPEMVVEPEVAAFPPEPAEVLEEVVTPAPPPARRPAPSPVRLSRRTRFRLVGAEPLPGLVRDAVVVGALLKGPRRGGGPSHGLS